MKFLIVGLGSVGRRHLRNLLSLGEKDIVLYRTHFSSLPDDELKDLPVETDLKHALDMRPDAVIISNPTSLHLEAAIPAARAGCHIFLEKPVSNSTEHLDDFLVEVERSGSRVQVGFQFRFHPTLQKAAELIRTAVIGKVLSAHVHWGEYLPNWHPWEDYRQSYAARADLGGGVIVTLTHPLDYLRWLLGDVSVLYSLNDHLSPLDLSVEDVAEIGLRFESGAIGGVHLNYFQRPPVHRLEIAGTGGTISWDNSDGVLKLQRMPAVFGEVNLDPPVSLEESFSPPAGFDRNFLFLEQMRSFISVVSGETMPVCTLQDGIQALKMALAARLSQSEGRVISMDGIR